MTIAEQIKNLGGAYARYSGRDHGTIEATVFDADDLAVGRISLTRHQVNNDLRSGLLTRSVLRDSARDPRYMAIAEDIRPAGHEPTRRYHYLSHYGVPDTDERTALRLAESLSLRLTWGVGGGRNRLHEEDWPTLSAALHEGRN